MVLLGNYSRVLKFLFTEDFSMSLGGNFVGLWSDLNKNDFIVNVGLTWWVNEIHGVSLEYNHALDQEVNFIGFKISVFLDIKA